MAFISTECVVIIPISECIEGPPGLYMTESEKIPYTE